MKCKDCYKEGCPYRCYTANAECVLQQWTAEVFDLQSFRNQVAKDILCALLNGNDGYHGDGENELFVNQSIGIADELIRQLKEKEEK